jgi:hypothetical protein
MFFKTTNQCESTKNGNDLAVRIDLHNRKQIVFLFCVTKLMGRDKHGIPSFRKYRTKSE